MSAHPYAFLALFAAVALAFPLLLLGVARLWVRWFQAAKPYAHDPTSHTVAYIVQIACRRQRGQSFLVTRNQAEPGVLCERSQEQRFPSVYGRTNQTL
jgi:hypothetical protein